MPQAWSGSRLAAGWALGLGLLAVGLVAGCGSSGTPLPAPASPVSPAPLASPIAAPTATSAQATGTAVPTAPPSPVWAMTPSRPPATPSPTAPMPPRTPSPKPTARWERIGRIEVAYPNVVVGSDSGYVAVGDRPGQPTGRPGSAWFSRDGISWEASRLGDTVDYCPGYEGGPVPRAQVTAGASNGTQMLLVGTEITSDACYDPANPGPERTVSWLSTDGRTWVRAGGPGVGEIPYPEFAWAIPGSWEVAVHQGLWGSDGGMSQSTAVWRSPDGQTWTRTSFAVKGTNMDFATASPAGQRLLTYQMDGRPVIVTSDDGETWRRIRGPAVEAWSAVHVEPPVAGGPRSWLMLTSAQGTEASTSADLAHWITKAIAPGRELSTAVGTPQGYVISVDPPCGYDLCGTLPQSQYVSPDGRTWTRLARPLEDPIHLVAGAEGVLAIGHDDGTVWRLDP